MEHNKHEGEALRLLLRSTGLQVKEIAKALQMTTQNLNYHCRQEKAKPGFVRIVKEVFPDLFLDRKPIGGLFVVNPSGAIENTNEPKEASNVSLTEWKEKNNMFIVPLKAYGGFLNGYERKVYENTLQRASFPLVRGECFAFEVEGFSMAPDYNPGDYFVGSTLEAFQDLVKSRPYVFQTIEGLILKMFEKIENDQAFLYSINPECNPVKPIHLKEIKKVYHKEAVIKF